MSLAQPNQADRVGFLNASRAPIMSRGAAGNFWALKTNENLCDMTRHGLKMRCNSQAVGYAVRASMMLALLRGFGEYCIPVFSRLRRRI